MTKKRQPPPAKKQPENRDDLHRRLDAALKATGQIGAPAGDERKRVLKERARLLAQEEEKILNHDMISIVEFVVASEHYGIETSFVKEILQIRELTHLPGTPPFLLGVINIRGEICPVIDLKTFFSLPERGLAEFNKVIVIENETMKFGIVTDAFVGNKEIPRISLVPPPPTFTGSRADYVLGVTPETVVILDGGKMLADKNLVVNEQV